ncbi:MAG: hypothetical protein H0X42_10915 [Solirubrobacterales bacterium]|nr:hypothetical protein [Solirubrobacterales bacterium]
MIEKPPTYRRQQRRRAIVAWVTLALFVAAIGLSIAFAPDERDHGHEPPNPFGDSMTSAQYRGLEPGLEQQAFVDRLEQTGLPENLTQQLYVELFPPHSEDVLCSFWEISDRPEHVARVCFSDPEGRLVQKLERGAADEPIGVTA